MSWDTFCLRSDGLIPFFFLSIHIVIVVDSGKEEFAPLSFPFSSPHRYYHPFIILPMGKMHLYTYTYTYIFPSLLTEGFFFFLLELDCVIETAHPICLIIVSFFFFLLSWSLVERVVLGHNSCYEWFCVKYQ